MWICAEHSTAGEYHQKAYSQGSHSGKTVTITIHLVVPPKLERSDGVMLRLSQPGWSLAIKRTRFNPCAATLIPNSSGRFKLNALPLASDIRWGTSFNPRAFV